MAFPLPDRTPDRSDENAWRSRDDEALDAVLARGSAAPPPTFAARGVAVSFTTPMLAQSRIRRAQAGGAPELVVPNAVGHRGWYVVPWDGVPALAPLTLHDRVLHAHLATLAQPTPGTVRSAARIAAKSGLAGRGPMAAALAAEEADRALHARIRTELMGRIAATTGVKVPTADAEDLTGSGSRALLGVALRARQPASRIEEALDQLAFALVPLGGTTLADDAAIPAGLRSLVELRAALEDRAERAETDAARAAAHLVRILAVFERCARRTLATAQASVGDVALVLSRWHRPDSQIAGLLSRPAWVLDGWNSLAGLYRTSQAAQEPERPTLARLLQLAPSLPAEAETWTGEKPAWPSGHPRGLGEGQDWRDQALLMERKARLEAVRAIAP